MHKRLLHEKAFLNTIMGAHMVCSPHFKYAENFANYAIPERALSMKPWGARTAFRRGFFYLYSILEGLVLWGRIIVPSLMTSPME
ncbi:hypothetical protein [Geobacter sp. AOG1]|uniref:hypothetical protein n=1 Tax=Geobacter sp. AOG1 TaxID=1566346 RepID=UPI001CC56BBC|nr:hypothetical protein [Geobacter sp. AOG1]